MHKEELEYIPCELCGKAKDTPIMEINGWCIVRCTQCGLAYVNPRPRPQSILKMYRENTRDNKSWAPKYADFYRQRFQRDILLFSEYLGKVQRHKAAGRFLDVGCGTGASLCAAKEAGWEAYGVEVGDWTQKQVPTCDLNIVAKTLDQASFPDHYFDTVFSKSFLEHVPHPKSVLKEMYRILKDDGLLVCAGIPNLDCFTIRLGIDLFSGNSPPAHLYYFQPRTLTQMIHNAGFRVERVSTWGLPNDFFAGLFRTRPMGQQADSFVEAASTKRSEQSMYATGYRWIRSATNTVLNWLKMGAVIDVYAWKV